MDDKKQWLKQRQKGIGGSDAPVVVLGDYYGKTKQDLFLEKTSPVINEQKINADMRRGLRQEPIAAQLFEDETGLKLRRVNKILTHPKHNFMLANVDRLITGKNEIVEIKCPRYMTYNKWKREGIPEGAIIQGQHYCAFGYKRVVYGIFCAEVDEILIVPVERDNSLIDMIVDKEGDFWRYVEAREMPPLEQVEIDLPKIGGELIKLDTPQWIKAADNLRIARELQAEAAALESEARNKIQNIMSAASADVVEGGGVRIYWREQAGRKRFDKKMLAAEHPEIDLSAYEKQGNPFKVFKPYFLTNYNE